MFGGNMADAITIGVRAPFRIRLGRSWPAPNEINLSNLLSVHRLGHIGLLSQSAFNRVFTSLDIILLGKPAPI